MKNFLTERWSAGGPLLLALSGGPDSLALFHLLLCCKRFFSLDLHLVHVDHSWRPKSREEAEILQCLAAEKGVPFHLKRLPPPGRIGNLEAEAREARLCYFSALYQREGAQALLLAHQADDQAETVLKRLFEGSGLLALGGLREESFLEGMRLWRPLLRVRKRDLEGWLHARGISAFVDPTNDDPRFLRGRMRARLLPLLAEEFGKESCLNLVGLGETAAELSDYLERRIAPYLASALYREGEVVIDLSPFLPIEKLEFVALCRRLARSVGGYFSREILDAAYAALTKRSSRRRFFQGGRALIVDRGHLISVRPENPVSGMNKQTN